MKKLVMKLKPKTISRNELHFHTQLTTRGAIHKDKTKYDRRKNKRIPKGENYEY